MRYTNRHFTYLLTYLPGDQFRSIVIRCNQMLSDVVRCAPMRSGAAISHTQHDLMGLSGGGWLVTVLLYTYLRVYA